MVGAILAATALITTLDEKIADNIIDYHNRHTWLHLASKNYTQLGGWGAWTIAGGFLAGGLLVRDSKAKDTGRMALEAMAHVSVLTGFCKYAFGRQRPFVEDGKDRWLGIWGMAKYIGTGRANNYTSFFSGHTAITFSLATVISKQYRNHGWVPWVCYALAGVEGLTRTVEYKHWLSDVVIGAVVGIGIGKMVWRHHRKRRTITPVIVPARGGASLGFVF